MRLSFTIFLIITLSFTSLQAQTFGIGTDNPDPNAIMELNSTSLGFLMTRLTTAQRNSNLTGLTGAQQGLLIYNTDDDEFNYWDGAMWIPFPGGLDHDWYEANTSTAPDNIADNVYTNGLVGIGLSNPSQSLHIANTSGAIQSILVQDLAAGGNAYNPSLATVARGNRASVIVDKTNGLMYAVDADDIFWRLDGNAGIAGAGYSAGCPNLISTSMNASSYDFIGTRDNTDFIFATNDIERMRILRDGQMVFYGKGITVPVSSPTGCIPAYPTIDVASFYSSGAIYPLNAYSEGAPAVYGASQYNGVGWATGVEGVVDDIGYGVSGGAYGNTTLSSVGVAGYEGTGAGWAGEFTGDVDVTGLFGYYNSSDERLKKNIKTIEKPIEKLQQIKGVSYTGNMEEYGELLFVDRKKLGVIAQDVEQVFPELVRKSKLTNRMKYQKGEVGEIVEGEFLTVNYDGLIPVLIEAVKEQQAQIDDLKEAPQTSDPNPIPNHQFGTIVLNANGKASITVPNNFTEKYNEFSYQLTSVGSPTHSYVSKELNKGEFEVSGQPNAKVSWVIYGE